MLLLLYEGKFYLLFKILHCLFVHNTCTLFLGEYYVYNTAQKNAQARRSARSSCTVRTHKPAEEVKNAVFCSSLEELSETQEVEISKRKKPQER